MLLLFTVVGANVMHYVYVNLYIIPITRTLISMHNNLAFFITTLWLIEIVLFCPSHLHSLQSVFVCIDVVTVFDAILRSKQTCEKLQCLYENLMSINFRKAAVLKKKKKKTCKLKLQNKAFY